MLKYKNFKIFLKSKWWFLLLAFTKAFRNSEITGSDFFDILFFVGIILLILYIYWLLRYKIKK